MPGNRDTSRRLLAFARELRHDQTDAEQRMWTLLRDRKLSGFKFRRQHPIEGYIVDFVCLRAKLVVELDGGQHSEPAQLKYDERRTKRLSQLGIRVLRFWDCDVLRDTDAVMEMIYNVLVPDEHLNTKRPSPQPSPGVPGEGESPNK